METHGSGSRTNHSLAISTALYWFLLLSFALSYAFSGSGISLVLTADRIVDAAGMTIALASGRIVMMPPTSRLSYGYHRFESLSSILMIFVFVLFLAYSGYVSYESIGLDIQPDPLFTVYASIISLAVLPVISYLLHGDQNLTTVTMSIHAFQDMVTTAMALVGSFLLLFIRSGFTGFVFSIAIIFVSIYMNRKLMMRNLRLLMEGTELDAESIESDLKKEFPMVHHLHIWDVCRHYRLATVHVYAEKSSRLEDLDVLRGRLSEYLLAKGVNHLTVQFESAP